MIDNSVSMQNSVSPTGAPFEAIDSAREVTNPPHLATGVAQRRSPGQRLLAALTALLPRNFPAFNLPSSGAAAPSSQRGSSRALLLTAFLAALTVGLLFLVPGGPAWAQSAEAIEYTENGTGSVATFTAVDPEGKSVTWSVLTDSTGVQDISGNDDDDVEVADVANSDLFSIDESSGVLTFNDAPDYETPQGGTASSNTYMLVVQVSDGAEMSWKKVEVEVTNEEEEATTDIELSSLQPQVSTEIMVAYTDGVGNPFVNAAGDANTAIVDPDKDKNETNTIIPADDVKWQWSRSSSRGGTYTDIPGDSAKEITYIPDTADANRYLRVTATYEDGEGEGEERRGDLCLSGPDVQGRQQRSCVPRGL